MIDPFEQSCEVSPRKMDTTSSSSGHSTRSGDLGSEVVSSSTTAASGLPPAGGGGGSGGTDELDQGGKSRGHISLGEKIFVRFYVGIFQSRRDICNREVE